MEKTGISYMWIVWFYIIAIYPFQLFDFYKLQNRKLKHYVSMLLLTLVVLFFLIGTFIGIIDYTGKELSDGSKFALYILIFMIYLQSIFDFLKNKSKRNLLSFGALTLILLIYFVLM